MISFRDFFSLPSFLSVLFHAALVALLILQFDWFKKEPEPYQPHYVTATLVDLKPKAKPAPQQPNEQVLDGKKDPDIKQLKQQKEQEKQEELVKAQTEKTKQEKSKKEAEEKAIALKKKKLEDEQKEKAELEKQRKIEKMRREELKAMQAQLQKEEKMLSHTVDDVNTKSYDEMIGERVAQNWNRPASAIKGMVTVLEIRMLPNGQVVGVKIVKSSGDVAFDRSAEQAVKKVDRFEEVKNIPIDIFERKYRVFTFTFNPGDLRR